MSLESLANKLGGDDEPQKPKTVIEAIGGRVGNLQAMLQAIKSAPKGKAAEVLQRLFGIGAEEAEGIVRLMVPEDKVSQNAADGSLRNLLADRAQENGIEKQARAQGMSRAMSKVIKKAASIADRMTEEDRDAGMQVLRDALVATTPYFNLETKLVEERIDLKTRLAALTLQLAYDEGLPVQRVLTGRVDAESAEETLARLRESPEAMRAIRGLKAAGVNIAIEGQVIEVEATVLTVENEEPEG